MDTYQITEMISQEHNMKRACSHFEIDSAHPETIKRKKVDSKDIDDNNSNIENNGNNQLFELRKQLTKQWRYNNNNNNMIYKNNNYDSISDIDNPYINNFNSTFNNIPTTYNNNNNVMMMTPISTPPNNTFTSIDNNNNNNNNNNTIGLSNINNSQSELEPYCEIEEYMVRGYNEFEQNQNINYANAQYSLYDLTQQEINMMILNDTTMD